MLENPTTKIKINTPQSLISDVHCFKTEYIHRPAGEEWDREKLMEVGQPAFPRGKEEEETRDGLLAERGEREGRERAEERGN